MSQSPHNGTPAYRRIQKAILERIDAGQLKPGDAVGSERELARLHGVSLMTARHALVGLEQDGRVERRRGAGTFVAPPKIHFNKLTSFSEQMASRGLVGYSKVLSASMVSDQAEISARLSLPSDGRLWKIERLRLGADEPFALETVYLSAQDFPGLARSRLERGSLFSLLEGEYGMTLAHADEEIDATTADAKAAHLLAVAPGAALLRIRQLIFSSGGKATLYVLGLYRSDRHTLHIRRFR
ncbi:MAG TPA: GntR family transcriptional regulator [Terriglobales bacterium]|nr:GntR family transcriptional regulator [Terriglobales bacterium]